MARVAANSYGTGEKYAGINSEGKNEFVREDGSRYTVDDGIYTSPSGKVSEISDGGRTTTTVKSRDESQIGNIYSGGEKVGTVEFSPAYYNDYNQTYGSGTINYGGVTGGGSGGRGGGVSMQVKALEQAMGNNKDALEAAYDASRGELESSISSAQQQAYINSQKALKNLPQAMAAGGYNGGVTETTAASIQNEYQNALNQLEQAKAQELARMQANLANGIADSESQYQIQLANALAQAEQLAWEQQQAEEEMALRKKAAALEEMKYLDSRNKAASGSGSGTEKSKYTINELRALYNDGLIDRDTFYELSGMPIYTPPLVPKTYQAALEQSQKAGNVQPLVLYYKSKGMSDAQIANDINAATMDKESALYGYTK